MLSKAQVTILLPFDSMLEPALWVSRYCSRKSYIPISGPFRMTILGAINGEKEEGGGEGH